MLHDRSVRAIEFIDEKDYHRKSLMPPLKVLWRIGSTLQPEQSGGVVRYLVGPHHLSVMTGGHRLN